MPANAVKLTALETKLLHALQLFTREAEPIVQEQRAFMMSEKRRKKQGEKR